MLGENMARRREQVEPGLQVSGLEVHAGFWLRFVSNHVSGRFRKLVEENGVTVSEWVALRALYDDSAVAVTRITTSTLVDSLGMTKGAVSKILARLEEKELVRREADQVDARVQRLALTEAGRALVPRLAALADQNDEHFFGFLEPAQRAALVKTLQNIVRAHGLTQLPTE
jgi:DNA-binding MarR family transcriptional regulator